MSEKCYPPYDAGMPLSSIDIDLKCNDRLSGRGIPCRGILEVFDNRVESKSPKEPLVSAIGDSYRGLSDYTSNWVDLTGYGADRNSGNSRFIKRLRMNIKGNLDDNVSAFNSLQDSTIHGAAAQNKPVNGTGSYKGAAYKLGNDLYLGYVDTKNFGGGKLADGVKQGRYTMTVGKGFIMDGEAGGAAANKNYRGSNSDIDHEWKNVSAGAYYMGTHSNAADSNLTMGNFDVRNIEKNNEERLPEIIREGEKKVVYCGVVATDKNGRARFSVQLPPQMGRCKIRFVALDKFDYLEKNKDIDVNKEIYVETSVPSFIIPGAHIIAKAHVTGRPGEKLTLKLSGACLEKEVSIDIAEGKKDFEFELTGKNYGALHVEIFDKSGKLLDRREVNIKNSASSNVTYSNIIISDGSPIHVKKGEKVQICLNPGTMLRGLVRNIVTTMYSWFTHAEALTAQAAIRATLLRAIDDKIIDDDGMRDILKSGLVKSIRDFNEKFFDETTGLVRPYPGMPVDITWSIWSAKNLTSVVNALRGSERLKNEFSDFINTASAMLEKMISELLRRGISIHELGMFDQKTGEDLIPVEIDGKVVYKALIDDAAVNWFVDKIIPGLDLPHLKNTADISKEFVKCYDKYRFLRAFERTGSLYYILLNLKSLFARKDKNFAPLFSVVARGLINTSEPGLIQGPALLGGVYSSPQTAVKFIELLVLMAGEKRIRTDAVVEVIKDGGTTEKIYLSDSPMTLEATESGMSVNAPEFAAVRLDETDDIGIFEHIENHSFFSVEFVRDRMNIGDEDKLTIQLEKGKDPSEYYAIIAVPSTLSIRQTDDLLSDYKGQLLYGQKSSGGAGMQLLTVPFRGSRTMTLYVEGARKGDSVGFITVRHIFNPEVVATVKTKNITVK